MKIRWLERIANISPYLILFTYIAGCMFCLLIDRVSYLINGSVMAVPAILGSFAFILIKKKDLDLSGKTEVFFIQPLKVRDVVSRYSTRSPFWFFL